MAEDGYKFAVRLGGTAVTGRITSSLNIDWDMLDATTADSSRAKEYISGESGWSVSVEGKLGASDTESVTQLKTAGDTRTPVAALIGRLEDDARQWSGNVLVQNLVINFPKNDVVTWTATLQGTGALTEGTYTTTA